MQEPVRPIVVVSKCLGFAACRYNGVTIPDPLVQKLVPFVEFLPVCAEVEIGLGVPRDPIRIVSVNGEHRLVQPATGRDVTDEMRRFAASYLSSLGAVDGFILKNRSPSCGLKDVRVYPSAGKVKASDKGSGFFGGAVLERFPDLAIEDEGRLTNYGIRDHFLTKLYTLARFRAVKAQSSMAALVAFHAANKLLLMKYSQQALQLLGRVVANRERRPLSEVLDSYQRGLYMALSRRPRCVSNINVLQHVMGYFSDEFSREEKAFFLDALEQYRSGKLPLSALTVLARSYIIRFGNDYLRQQTFFEPYPPALIDTTDSGQGAECSARELIS